MSVCGRKLSPDRKRKEGGRQYNDVIQEAPNTIVINNNITCKYSTNFIIVQWDTIKHLCNNFQVNYVILDMRFNVMQFIGIESHSTLTLDITCTGL